jgi:hypothetical protein
MGYLGSFATLILIGGAISIHAAEALSLRTVLERAGAYVVHYGDALSTVVASEEYVQQIVAATGAVQQARALRSEIAFVRLADTSEWQAFRDVISVDGAPVGREPGQLERLLRDAPRSVIPQARLLAAESARYNLGPLRRDFNAPTTALQFVHPVLQDRFRFDKQTEEDVGGERVWVVRFRERGRGTLIRTTSGRDVPVEGQLWIAPEDGRIVRTRFSAKGFLANSRGLADIDVSWRADAKLGLWVPATMRERYSGPWPDGSADPWPDSSADPRSIITGTATYTDYRRFDVDVRIIRAPSVASSYRSGRKAACAISINASVIATTTGPRTRPRTPKT